jgi:hypothetical protein
MSPVHPAPLQLADLAAAMRPDWDRTELEGAISAARQNDAWPWHRVFLEVARLLVAEDSSPRDLTAAARNPVGRNTPASPSVTREYAAACREFLATRGQAS